MENKSIVLNIHDKPKFLQWFTLSFQHLFAMFGSTVLVPTLTGMDPAVALVSSGLATLAFIAITQGKVPSYLGSSFAFISPIIAIKAASGAEGIMVGSFIVGCIYALIALIINRTGVSWLMKLLPPIVVGPIIMVIGLSLSSTAIDMITNNSGSYDIKFVAVGLISLIITIIIAIFTKGFISVIPVLIGIVGGYLFSIPMGLVDFEPIKNAAWFQIPNFEIPFYTFTPHFSWSIFLLMAPVAIVPIAEHIGHQLVLGKVINKDLVKDPGLDKSLFGDGMATIIASVIGGPPNTTYGENIGVLAITRAYSIYLFIGAAIFAIGFGFCGKIAALLKSIPVPVMGGISILLFGIIASSGLRMVVDSKVNFASKRNLIISSVILVLGIGGASIHLGNSFSLEGMALASLTGVMLNQILPGKEVVNFDSMFKE
ncbi:solute carrier family 23 protein [Apibacter raozihei]|uniref:solute carrier family 23 protein n=1 Tax=Apibacter raozihei TaxID=2500547 RepID=UPI000FE2A5CD|nr:solute carrier family 23 protein [Apibacter raozihei]